MIKLTKRGLGIGLIVSLALNLFLVGMIVTAVVFHKRSGGWAAYDRPFAHFIARRALERESRHKVDKIWRAARPDLRQRIGAVRASRRTVRRLLHADPLDRPALDRAFMELQTRSAAAHSAIQIVIGRVAETLDASERQAYFKRHRWRRHRREHRRYRRRDDD